jgi:hypothetical protein
MKSGRNLLIIPVLALSILLKPPAKLIWSTPIRNFELMFTVVNKPCLDIMTYQQGL